MQNGQENGLLFLFKWGGIAYLILLTYLLFFAFFREGTQTGLNLIPFKSMIGFFTEFHWHAWWYWVINLPGNIIAFIPLPIIANAWNIKSSTVVKILSALLIPIGIEGIQYLSHVGNANVDDVMLNAFGFWIGHRILKKRPMLFLPKS